MGFFQHRYLRHTLEIYWPYSISKDDLRRTGVRFKQETTAGDGPVAFAAVVFADANHIMTLTPSLPTPALW